METLKLIEPFRSVLYSPLYVIQSLRLFEDEGLEVSVRSDVAGKDTVAVLQRNEADVALTGPMRIFMAAAAGERDLPLSFIEVNSRDGFMLVSREPSSHFQWSDLEGKTVLIFRDPPTPWMGLLRALQEQDVDAERVELLSHGSLADSARAFREGAGDFVLLPEPMAEEFIASKLAYLAAPMGRFVGHVAFTSFAATDASLSRNRDAFLRFTRAVYAGQHWMAANNAAAIAELAAEYLPDVPLETLVAGTQRYQRQGTWAADPLLRRESFERLHDILREGGLIKGTHLYEDHVTTEFADAVMSERAAG